jgi:UDP-GlcNAc:undecaprenyl-phosphate GlcNAc-1-phosphate transferase
MPDSLIAGGVSFVLAWLLTPCLRDLALRLRLVDHPDGRRKLHPHPTPLVGGPVLLLAVPPALLLVFLAHGHLAASDVTAGHLAGLLLAALTLGAVGVLDDLRRLRGRHKLFGQLLAVAIVLLSGVRIDIVNLAGVDFPLGLVALPFTAFFLLGAINSLNLLDGMDGLLTSLAFIVCTAFGVLALLAGKDTTACVALALAGALLAFLWFNFPPATVFLGDSGSMVIGLAIGVVAIDSSLKRPATAALATPAALLTLPILDTLAAILRRKLTGRSLYATDRGHLHHCLQRRLVHPRRVLGVVCACGLVTAAGAVAGEVLGREWLVLTGSGLVVTALLAGRLFGHAELQLAVRRAGAMLSSLLHLRPADEPRQLAVHLQGSGDWGELWLHVTSVAGSMGLYRVRLDVNAPSLGEGYHARWDRGEERNEEEGGMWRARIPLSVGGGWVGELDITGGPEGEPIESKIGRLAEIVRAYGKPEGLARRAIYSGLSTPTPPPPTLHVKTEKADLPRATTAGGA